MKKILFILISAILLLGSFNMNAQKLSVTQQKKLDQLFKTEKVINFSFKVSSMQQIAGLAKIVSVERTKGNLVYAHATKDQFSRFMQGNYEYTVMPHAKAKAKTGTATKASTAKKTTKKPAAKK